MTAKDTLKPDGFRIAAGSLLLASLVINILSLALPVMTLQVYDRILPNEGSGTLPVLIAGVCVAILLEAMLRLCRVYVIGRAGAAYEHRMACAAIRHVLGADLAKMGAYGVGAYLHRLGAIGKLKDFYNGYALTVAAEMLFVPVFLGLIWYISGPLTVVPAAILGVFALVSLWRGHRLRAELKHREKADDARFDFLIEALEGVHTLKAFALEQSFARRYEALEEDACRANFAVTSETAHTFNTAAVFSHMMVAAVISVGAFFVLQGQLTTGGLIATLLLSGRVMQPVQKALALWMRYQDYALAREHVKGLFATPQRPFVPDATPMPEPTGSLEISNITFRHEGETAPLLDGVSLSLRPGETVLLAGAAGSGKTTLLNLIAGAYTPDSGVIRIDGRDILSTPPDVLPRHVGYIRTSSLIFRGTIRDNITCFGQTREAQAREVASLLQVDKDVARLPAGFDTFLSGTDTDSITPGLRQRIAIVRALAAKPRLVLFDSADRALDRDGYAMVYTLLTRLRGKATVLIVSGDKNITALATRTYVLKNGKVTEDALQTDVSSNIRPWQQETRP